MICPLEIASDLSALRAARVADHGKHGWLLEGRDGAGDELCETRGLQLFWVIRGGIGLTRRLGAKLQHTELFKSTATRASCGRGPFHNFYAALLAKGMKPEMARLT